MGEEITQKHTICGIASIICGIISFILIFMPRGFIPSATILLLYFIANLTLAILGIGFGIYSFRIQKFKDDYGKIGIVLGLLAVIIVILQFWILSIVTID